MDFPLAQKSLMISVPYQAIRKLQPDERELICALFFEEVSLRSYARRKGVTHRAVQKWRDAILKELRKLMDME